MANLRLKQQLIEAVENQLRVDEPKCVGEALKRLIEEGADRQKAKEMIAAVLLEEMYDILKEKETFNEERYTQKMNALRWDSKVVKVNEYRDYTMQELLKAIEYNAGVFPADAILEIIRREDEAIPFLLDILKNVLKDPHGYASNGDYFAHIYAAYLLAQFRVKDAYPVFIEILKLPDELPHLLYGESITEAGSRILASICDNDVELIKELIVNDHADEYVRAQAVEALSILALHGLRSREEILRYYRELLTGGIEDENELVIAEVVSSCNNLYPEEVMEEIYNAFEQELVDESSIDLDFVESTLTEGRESTLKRYREDIHHQFINDTIEELKGWYCFHKTRDEVHFENEISYNQPAVRKVKKIGRNEPCPCGSGKKHKKCCGKHL